MVSDDSKLIPNVKPEMFLASCALYSGNIPGDLLDELEKKSAKEHILKGETVTEPVPVACFQASSEKTFRQFKKKGVSNLFPWVWPTPFGQILTLSVHASGGELTVARIFVPADEQFGRSFIETGRLVFFISFNGKKTELYQVDFSKRNKSGAHGLKTLFENQKTQVEILLKDFDLAFWYLLGNDPNGVLPIAKEFLTHQDQLSIDWARDLYQALGKLRRLLVDKKTSSEETLNTKIIQTDDVQTFQNKYPTAFNIFRLIGSPSPSISELLRVMSKALENPGELAQIMYVRFRTVSTIDGIPDDLYFLFDMCFEAVQRSTEVTECGTRRLWLKNSTDGIEAHYMTLDKLVLGRDYPNYWSSILDPSIYPFNLGLIIEPGEGPAKAPDSGGFFLDLTLDCSQEEAIECYRLLIEDASENAQWTIPWGARLQINLAEFNYVDLYQIHSEIYFVFRSPTGYLFGVISLLDGKYVFPKVSFSEQQSGTEDWELCLVLLLASAVRDFTVVEERDSVFSTKTSRQVGKFGNKKQDEKLKVIYVPRVRYLNANPQAYMNNLPHVSPKIKHQVRPHFRKSSGSSTAQQWLAKHYGFQIPMGHTFVRPHSRGGQDKETQVIYRSKSASKLIYTAIDKGTGQARWFEFERDVAAYMGSIGYQVQHRSADRNGDGGVDVYAYDPPSDEAWAIQCKCWAPHMKVGPEVVRALHGSLDDYPDGTRGMIITTSTFTSGAIEEAQKKSIVLVNGDEFVSKTLSASRDQLTHSGDDEG